MKCIVIPTLLLSSYTLLAHPMGNFSVNHYSRLELAGGSVKLVYVLDLAEMPTFQLFQQWNADSSQPALLEEKARRESVRWLSGIHVVSGGKQVHPKLVASSMQLADGAGGMPVSRFTITAALPVAGGRLELEDTNYAGRTGWKEIVVTHDRHVNITQSTNTDIDLSHALTAYPSDSSVVPPQDLRASVTFVPVVQPLPVAAKPPQAARPAPAATFSQQQASVAGTVVKGDFLSRMLHHGQLGIGMIVLGLCVAFGLGGVHALSPGHGKTIVAAYLVGTRGTLRHALFLGGMVTFTHTFSVFMLGLGMLLFQQYVVPEKIIPVLGAISGLSIVAIGALLLYRRTRTLAGVAAAGHVHHHAHEHAHHHGHHHDHSHDGAHHHSHGYAPVHTHTHDGSTHSHEPPEKVTMGSLVALGASGGLVPCPSALILMLSAIALGRPGLGLMLLLSFSAGLAVVLMAIGAAVIYAAHLLPDGARAHRHPLFQMVPVFSAVVVMVLGVLMAASSMGWVRVPFSLG